MNTTKMHVVIGAAYGDEGKGLMTDYLTNKILENGRLPLVVRFNGGAQAGHTVVTPGGIRHVFHHFGSGSLLGAPTFLGPKFICNPMLFAVELKQLAALDIVPIVYVAPGCPLTTPYDMILNQFLETQRGSTRHGSCGAGINETIERETFKSKSVKFLIHQIISYSGPDDKVVGPGAHLTYTERQFCTEHKKLIRLVVQRLIDVYYRERFTEALRDEKLRCEALAYLDNEQLLNDFVEACSLFSANVVMTNLPCLVPRYELVFEGAQGLLLDEHHKNFPHVTRSSTGLRNVVDLCLDIKQPYTLDVYYMHRAYSTRHGAGPFPEEEVIDYKVVDETNVPNQFQGSLRFGAFDVRDYLTNVNRDSETLNELEMSRWCKSSRVHTVVTCVDQVLESNAACFIDEDGERQYLDGRAYEQYLARSFSYLSYGPTRNTIFARSELYRTVFNSPLPKKENQK